jgi:hypothetical protein
MWIFISPLVITIAILIIPIGLIFAGVFGGLFVGLHGFIKCVEIIFD